MKINRRNKKGRIPPLREMVWSFNTGQFNFPIVLFSCSLTADCAVQQLLPSPPCARDGTTGGSWFVLEIAFVTHLAIVMYSGIQRFLAKKNSDFFGKYIFCILAGLPNPFRAPKSLPILTSSKFVK